MSMPDEYQLLRTIDLFRTLFFKRGNPDPINSARYYVIYTISGCGSTFTSVLRNVQKIQALKGFRGRRKVERGRELLVKDGMIAKILFHHKTNPTKENKLTKESEIDRIFQGEQYLPVNPILIYEDLSQRPETNIPLHSYEGSLLLQLGENWKENFREHGFLIEKGILTVYCTAPWLLFSLLNYLPIRKKSERTLYIMTSSTKWCSPLFLFHVVPLLDEDLEMKVLLDMSKKTDELERLRKTEQVEIRHLPWEEVITNRLTLAGTQYVVDMHKILGTEDNYSNYIATIYLDMKDIAEQFKASFETRWEHASSI